VPPRKKENLRERLPESLKSECLVRAKIEKDEAVLKQRQELTRAKSPSELSEIRSFKDIPVPAFVQNIRKKKEPADHEEEEWYANRLRFI
jgi:hypothetical protein